MDETKKRLSPERLPDGRFKMPDGTIYCPDDDSAPTESFTLAMDGDRTAALEMFKSFVEYNASSNNESTRFVAHCLAMFLDEVKPGMSTEEVGDLLRKSFRQKGRIDTSERRTACIKSINAFCNDMTSKERNNAIRANLKATGLDDGASDAQLNKIITDTLRRK